MKKFLGAVLILVGISPVSICMAQSRMDDAQALGWVINNNTVCKGYFTETPMPVVSHSAASLKSQPVTITAQAGQLKYSGTSALAGPVVISQPGREVDANNIELITDKGEYKTAKLKGHVVLREKGKMAIGQEADLNLQTQNYSFSNIIYRILIGQSLSAWGKAENANQLPDGMTILRGVTYSSCPPQSRAWELSASKIKLNPDAGRGSAFNAVFYSNHIPVFYMPYINFPIDDRRQSGFLYPQFSFGAGDSGFGLGLPFYWNMAPNYDDTITPTYYTKRGFLFNNLFRYLTDHNTGNINFSILPNDKEFKQFQYSEQYLVPFNTPGLTNLQQYSATRTYLAWEDQSHWGNQWSGGVNYYRVSDDYFPTDIGGVTTAAQNQLLQQGQINYKADSWQFLGNMQAYQTLHPVDQALVLNQYSMLPQLLFTSYLPIRTNQLSPAWSAEFVNFSEAPNPGVGTIPPSGKRLNLIPSVSLPLANPKGYVTPQVQFELTRYSIGGQMVGSNSELTRTVPIINIDSGVYLDRDVKLFSQEFNQTLEPRIFYLYVPYRDQHQIPAFDSSLQPFTYDQLFLTNRFSGNDRIGDANQISFAVSTKLFNKNTGEEKFSAGIGIIKYFEDRQVTLCQTVGCADPLYAVGSTSPTALISPVVGKMTYHINPAWSASVGAAWDPDVAQMENTSVNFQYNPAENHVINIGYSYVRYGDYFLLPGQTAQLNANLTTAPSNLNLSQPTASIVWPITSHLNLVGSWSYSWNLNHSLAYFSGVQYDSCCWAFQTVLARNYNGLDPFGNPQFTTGVYVQLIFKGLAKVATNDPTNLLLGNIPGYKNNFVRM